MLLAGLPFPDALVAVALKPLGADSMSDRALLREAIKSTAYVWLDTYIWRAPQKWVEVRGGCGSSAVECRPS